MLVFGLPGGHTWKPPIFPWENNTCGNLLTTAPRCRQRWNGRVMNIHSWMPTTVCRSVWVGAKRNSNRKGFAFWFPGWWLCFKFSFFRDQRDYSGFSRFLFDWCWSWWAFLSQKWQFSIGNEVWNVVFSPLPGEIIQFDEYFSNGWKPSTRSRWNNPLILTIDPKFPTWHSKEWVNNPKWVVFFK